MKMRKQYRPKLVRLDNMGFVKSGMRPLSSVGDELERLKILIYPALEAAREGRATRESMCKLLSVLNMGEALANAGLGKKYLGEIRAGQDAVFAFAHRLARDAGAKLSADELEALQAAIFVHEGQLDICTVKELETARVVTDQHLRNGKARLIPRPIEQEAA